MQYEAAARGDDDLAMFEVSADEVMADPIAASEEEPRDSGVVPEPLPADLPQDFDDFKLYMDATFENASDEFVEARSTPPVVEEGCEAIGEVHLSSSGLEQGVSLAAEELT
ncbi:hypothetical protein AAC387_Pa08g1356 [Persea americana]